MKSQMSKEFLKSVRSSRIVKGVIEVVGITGEQNVKTIESWKSRRKAAGKLRGGDSAGEQKELLRELREVEIAKH